MKVGVPREIRSGETRVAATPDTVKKLCAHGLEVVVERDAGRGAHFHDEAYQAAGATLGSAAEALAADIVFKVHKPTDAETARMKRGALLVSFMELCNIEGKLNALAQAGVDAFALELIPRISRAQAMDALSSQSNIAGYRAVLEAESVWPLLSDDDDFGGLRQAGAGNCAGRRRRRSAGHRHGAPTRGAGIGL